MSNRTAALCRLLAPPPDPRADGDLLTAFVRNNDETAFAELIRRHGPLMLSACRRLLPDHADAEDAFQSAFVVLIRRASRLNSLPSLGPWLYRVAVLTAQNIRRHNARRFARQSVLPDSIPEPSSATTELRLDLDAALLRLPEKLRTPIVLCHLQGWSRRDAAQRLGCPEGTLSSLLARGLEKLRRRLSGFDPVKMLAVPAFIVPAALSTSTVRAATTALASGAILPTLSTLAEGVLRMFWIKKTTAATMALAAVFGMGVSIGVAVRQVPHAGADDGPATPLGKFFTVADNPKTAEELAKAIELIYDADGLAKLDDIKQQYLASQADLEVAITNLRRADKANLDLAKNSGTPLAIEKAKAEVDQAEAKEVQAEKRHELLAAQLNEYEKKLKLLARVKDLRNEKLTAPEVAELQKELAKADAELHAARKALDIARDRIERLKKNAKDPKELKLELDKLQTEEKQLESAQERVKFLQERLAKLSAEQPKATPAGNDDKQLAETKALLEELRAQRARLEADIRKLHRTALDLDAKSDAVMEQLKLLELKKAKEAKEKALLPPLPAAGGSGPAFVVTIGEENPNVVCTLTESGANGKTIGTLTCDNADILRVTLTRAAKDPAAPKELRISVKPTAKYAQVVAVLDACKAAGFKDVKVSSVIQKTVNYTTSGPPVVTPRTISERIEESTTIDRYLEKIKPLKP